MNKTKYLSENEYRARAPGSRLIDYRDNFEQFNEITCAIKYT